MLTGDYQTLIYEQTRAGQTLHDVLFNTIGLSARLYRKLKKHRAITVNGHAISVNAKLRPGDEIVVRLIDANRARHKMQNSWLVGWSVGRSKTDRQML